MSNVEKWQSRLKLRRISTVAIIVLSIVTIIIILLTIYGLNVGNFVITVPSGRNGLALSETADFPDPKSMLSATGMRDQREATYSWLPVSDLAEKDGSNNDPARRWIAYSFYVKNAGKDTINYEYSINITSVSKKVDSAIRVLIKHQDYEDVYAKWQEFPAENQGLEEIYPLEIKNINFLSTTEICRKKESQFAPQEIRKFLVIIWLEGNDPECTDNIMGGNLKMEMTINIAD